MMSCTAGTGYTGISSMSVRNLSGGELRDSKKKKTGRAVLPVCQIYILKGIKVESPNLTKTNGFYRKASNILM